MRRILIAFGLCGLMATPALAEQAVNTPRGEYTTEQPQPGKLYRIRLDRSVFDQVGPRVNIHKLCGKLGARSVTDKRSISDIGLTVVSLGFYTPTHELVACNLRKHM